MSTKHQWAARGTWKSGDYTGVYWTTRKEAISDVQKMRATPDMEKVELLKRDSTEIVYLTYRPTTEK